MRKSEKIYRLMEAIAISPLDYMQLNLPKGVLRFIATWIWVVYVIMIAIPLIGPLLFIMIILNIWELSNEEYP